MKLRALGNRVTPKLNAMVHYSLSEHDDYKVLFVYGRGKTLPKHIEDKQLSKLSPSDKLILSTNLKGDVKESLLSLLGNVLVLAELDSGIEEAVVLKSRDSEVDAGYRFGLNQL